MSHKALKVKMTSLFQETHILHHLNKGLLEQ